MKGMLQVLVSLALAMGAGGTRAQNADGFHSFLVFPVVVDSASFTQAFWFRSISISPVLVPTFYPAGGGAPIACPSFGTSVAGNASAPSLRSLCPDIPAGSVFGLLTVVPESAGPAAGNPQLVAGFSRVSNPAGAGFNVEAYPWHAFSTGYASVSGLVRRAASPSGPALQTNCFIGMMPSVAGSTKPSKAWVGLGNAQGAAIGSLVEVDLVPGKLVRLLDVFAAVGAPAGDHANASLRMGPVLPDGYGDTGLLGFCTVQDNTSFNADFRIAKTEFPASCLYACNWDGPMDETALRSTLDAAELPLPGQAARSFVLPAGEFQNTHAYYFHHPDTIDCTLRAPLFHEPLPGNAGVEMRLLDEVGTTIAGGNGVVWLGGLQLGDKMTRGRGANARYFLQVERSGDNAGAAVAYEIGCDSGSGHTPGDLVRYQVPLDQF
jgi:hypothetical protein